MRQLGCIKDEKLGQRFLSYLQAQGIDSELRDDDDGYGLWVIDEECLAEALADFEEFKKKPDDQRFQVRSANFTVADKKPASNANYIDVRRQIFSRSASSQMPVAIGMIVISVLATIFASMPDTASYARFFYFSEYYGRGFPEIRSGQLWRIITPIFIHGGLMHLGFNMLWLYQLGGMIERIEGSRYLLIMSLTIAALCNTAQYLIAGPLFVGFSGVVYGLLGYAWMMSRYQAGGQYVISQQLVGFMAIWLVICLIGIIPNVANTQHVVGFASGIIYGFIYSGGLKTWRRRRDFKNRF